LVKCDAPNSGGMPVFMSNFFFQGQASEWALLRRHAEEDMFGVQICGAHPDTVARAAELIERECQVDFIDLNLGCPIDLVVNKGAGSSLLTKPARLEQIVRATAAAIDTPLTLKVIHKRMLDISKAFKEEPVFP